MKRVWSRILSKSTGRYYWFNTATGEKYYEGTRADPEVELRIINQSSTHKRPKIESVMPIASATNIGVSRWTAQQDDITMNRSELTKMKSEMLDRIKSVELRIYALTCGEGNNLSAQSASDFYNNLVKISKFEEQSDMESFNIQQPNEAILDELDKAAKEIFEWKEPEGDAVKEQTITEEVVQSWFTQLQSTIFSYLDSVGLRTTTNYSDTGSSPYNLLGSNVKPSISYYNNFYPVSAYSLISLCDVKQRNIDTDDYTAADRGKTIDTALRSLQVQLAFRSKGFITFMSNSKSIVFYNVQWNSQTEAISKIFVSEQMPLQGLGGVWLLALLCTPLDYQGYTLPNLTYKGRKIALTDFLGSGSNYSVYAGNIDSETERVAIRIPIKYIYSDMVESEEALHSEVFNALKKVNKQHLIVERIGRTDDNFASIIQPVGESLSHSTQLNKLKRSHLLSLIDFGSQLQRLKMVHLDLSLSNIVLYRDRLVVIDLDSLRRCDEIDISTRICGNMHYGSKEMISLFSRKSYKDFLHFRAPTPDDDWQSILRIIYVALIRGKYEALHQLEYNDAEAINKFWDVQLSGGMWKQALQFPGDYTVLTNIVNNICPPEA